jgi:hypothetical protein
MTKNSGNSGIVEEAPEAPEGTGTDVLAGHWLKSSSGS